MVPPLRNVTCTRSPRARVLYTSSDWPHAEAVRKGRISRVVFISRYYPRPGAGSTRFQLQKGRTGLAAIGRLQTGNDPLRGSFLNFEAFDVYLRCLETSAVISNMETCFLPPK